MKLSTRTRYGLRIMLDIAEKGGNGPIPMRDIAARQNISIKYVEKLLRELRSAGYLESRLGVHGGYELARPARSITVGEIVMTMEGGLDLVDCWLNNTICTRHTDCLACTLWTRLSAIISDKLNAVSLEDLLLDGQRMQDVAKDFRELY